MSIFCIDEARKLMREKRAALEFKRQKHSSTVEKKPAEETSTEKSVAEKKKATTKTKEETLKEVKHDANDVKTEDSVPKGDPFL